MVLVALTLISSCKQARFKKMETSAQATDDGVAQMREPHILFLFMKAEKTEAGEVIRIENHSRVEGSLKDVSAYKQPLKEGIRYVFSNADGERTDTFWQEHPLHRHVEVADDEGRLQSRTITLKEAELSLRIPDKSWYTTLEIEGIYENSPIKKLTTKPYKL